MLRSQFPQSHRQLISLAENNLHQSQVYLNNLNKLPVQSTANQTFYRKASNQFTNILNKNETSSHSFADQTQIEKPHLVEEKVIFS